MALLNRKELIGLGFEEGDGPVMNEYQDYVVLRFFIHKEKPWIRVEEHCPKQYLNHMLNRHIIAVIINYGTKDGEIVYSVEEVQHYLLHHMGFPQNSDKLNVF